MEIILKEDIKNLGYKNDLIEVKPGFGRNYLIPAKKSNFSYNYSQKSTRRNAQTKSFQRRKNQKRSRNFC
jgi:large subunit ribosomal protein L9